MTDAEIRLLYTFVCVPPFDLLVFYVFRDRLRFAQRYVVCAYMLVLALTQAAQMSLPLDMSMIALLCRPLALFYMLLSIRDQPLRVLSIALLVYPLLMLAGTLGTMAEFFFGAGLPPGLWKCLLIPMMFLLILPAALHTNRHLLAPMLQVDDRRLWLYLCGYEVILVALAVAADPANTSVQPTILAARLLLPLALVQYLRVSTLLTRYAEKGNALHQQQLHEQMIRTSEEARYQMMLSLWRSSRRMRHDLRHHMTVIAQLAHEASRERLAAYLDNLAEQFAKQKAEEHK
ncbi:beta-carotene 15,15'-monooxygenase [Selenomonas sputigena]|uniref:Beta-carotene 15,15'-monooxygenase n=1 Tax=Selenomonas sputigena TaxID=69823 RepID=A0ABV3X7C4_9FIRM